MTLGDVDHTRRSLNTPEAIEADVISVQFDGSSFILSRVRPCVHGAPIARLNRESLAEITAELGSDKSLRQQTAAALSDAGYEVSTAYQGE